MFQKNILGIVLILTCLPVPAAYAGKVELTTYYPAPSGEYNTLQSNQTCVGTNCAAADVGTGNLRVKRNATTSAGGDLTVDNLATIKDATITGNATIPTIVGSTTVNNDLTVGGKTRVGGPGAKGFVIQLGTPTGTIEDGQMWIE